MSRDIHDTKLTAPLSARVAPQAPGDGWIKPSHGKGMLKPWRKGETGRVSNVASRYVETQRYARENSMKALRTLVERLDDVDGRIAVVAANSILERAWGKTREQRPEEQPQARIDLSQLSATEMKILLDLAMSGRLRADPGDAEQHDAPLVIDAKPGDEQ